MEVGSAALGAGPEMAAVEDIEITQHAHSVTARIYRPAETDELASAVLYFHGGGWVIGSVTTHDAYCRQLAAASGSVVISVDYRRAPEHRFPAAAEDAYAAVCWTVKHAERLRVKANRLAVAGDSAGGNLAAAATLMSRDRAGPPIVLQVLVYPVLDFDFERPSYTEFADGYLLSRASMIWFWEQYFGDTSGSIDPLAAPLRAESLSRLPPALVITAECDPLRDEGEAYARRLQQAGVAAKLVLYEGMIHGFARRTKFFTKAQHALDEVAAAVRLHLS
jgi:acetyl esterase